MHHNAIDVEDMASGAANLTFDLSISSTNGYLVEKWQEYIFRLSDARVTINVINVAVTHGVPIAPFFTPEVAGFERLSATSYSIFTTHYDALTWDATARLRSRQTPRITFHPW